MKYRTRGQDWFYVNNSSPAYKKNLVKSQEMQGENKGNTHKIRKTSLSSKRKANDTSLSHITDKIQKEESDLKLKLFMSAT